MTSDVPALLLETHFLDATEVPMLAVDLDGRVTDVNSATLRQSQRSREHWVGSEFASHFSDRGEAEEVFREALSCCGLSGRSLRVPGADGQVAELELHLACAHDANGRLLGLFVEARDITSIKAAEQRLMAASHYARSLLEASLDPLVTISPDGKIMDVNRATELITGRSRDSLIGSDFSDYFTEPEKARAGYRQVFSSGHVTDYPLVLRHTSGSTTDVLYNATVHHDESGHVAGVFAAARDITQLKRSQEALESTNREVMLLGQMTGLLQSCRTVEESLPILRETMAQLFPGSSGQLLLLRPSGNLLEDAGTWGGHPQSLQTAPPADCWALRRGHIHDIGFERTINPPCRHIDADDRPYLCIPLLAQGTALGILHLVIDPTATTQAQRLHYRHLAAAAADSISLGMANLRLRESLHAMSIRDPLTGLYNRRFMEEALAREISRMTRANKPLTIAMLDIDHFKRFNDTYGHEAGDIVLKDFALLMSSFREGSDLACRYGGEEFLLILPELGPEQARSRLDGFREDVGHLNVMLHGKPLPNITVSIGLASLPAHAGTSANLIKAADDALYRAKQGGRNRVEVATAGHPADKAAADAGGTPASPGAA
ncbi:hypothetical protein MASR2M50_29890 [Thauera sp.]